MRLGNKVGQLSAGTQARQMHRQTIDEGFMAKAAIELPRIAEKVVAKAKKARKTRKKGK